MPSFQVAMEASKGVILNDRHIHKPNGRVAVELSHFHTTVGPNGTPGQLITDWEDEAYDWDSEQDDVL